MANSQLMDELKKRYGVKVGTQIYLKIVPSILADFKKVLKEKAPDEVVSETYRFEDENGGITVTGSRDASGQMQIEAHLSIPENDC